MEAIRDGRAADARAAADIHIDRLKDMVIRDGIAQGKPLACYNIGHFNWEELGMKYAADWIGDLVDHQLPVHYVPTGDAFSYL